MPPTILLTGATGYIGSHTWIELLDAGYDVMGVDNFINSSPIVLDRIKKITGKTPIFINADMVDYNAIKPVFNRHLISAVIHFAALKSVNESVSQPLKYYANNLNSLLTLCRCMNEANVKKLVFSSSAAIYGNPATVPIRENFSLSATNPYGQTKLIGEQILRDLEQADSLWKMAYLRYFNPAGAHQSGLIGEDFGGMTDSLMRYIAKVAVKQSEKVAVFGSDYPTADGTGIRDYIHVVDLAKAHLAALHYLEQEQQSITVNVGTGRGYSVLDVIAAYQKASKQLIPYQLAPRRPGDVACCYADPTLAKKLLGWRAIHDLEKICMDSWHWQSQNPQGYQ